MSNPEKLQRVDIDAMVVRAAKINGGVFGLKDVRILVRDIYYILRSNGVDLRNIQSHVEGTISRLGYRISTGAKFIYKLEDLDLEDYDDD